MVHFKKVVIIGVGLIGGSIGKAIRRLKLADEVIGIFRSQKPKVKSQKSEMTEAIKLGAIDICTQNLREGVKDADLVIIATPVKRIASIAKKVSNYAPKGCIITDVGSTKKSIVSSAESALSRGIYFVGGHPMAGSEKKGVEFCNDRLFEGAVCILTSTDRTYAKALNKVLKLWEAIGSKVIIVSPDTHDIAVARISHLPHIVACSLLNIINNKEASFCSGGFRDITRIASSDPLIWRDICLENRDNIIDAIDRFSLRLAKLKKLISAQDAKKLMKEFRQAKKIRERIYSLV